jgi:DNA polymerase-3 subunit epsilon
MSFDELGRPLRDITFCVVDLETTGASVQGGAMITEIGAVKVRGGEVLGEFQTLVNPHAAIPPFIAVLTGITNSMVASSPSIESALPAFLEFAQGSVLVAHNAPFDIGFLKHFAAAQSRPWPHFEVLDTARLARRVITRDDAPNCKLSSLAVAFGASTVPNHRALSDGTSRDLRTRVRTYFTASEMRSRMGEMVNLAASVTGIECATPLEARVRELRLIAAHKPRYNRRSRHPEKMHWLKLTVEPWPRLSLVRKVAEDGADYLGPFASRRTAEKCLVALHEAFPIRQCSDRIPITPTGSACALAEMGRCLAPCDGSISMDDYAEVVATVRANLLHRADEVVLALTARMDRLAVDERFEEAGVHRERLSAFVRAASRTQRLGSLSSCSELVAARREDDRRWAVHVVRHGRLAAAGVIPPDAHAGVWVTQLRESAETVAGGPGPVPAASAEESEQILRWLEQPGVRLVHVDGEWTCPVRGATRHLAVHDAVEHSRASLAPFDERRTLATVHQP